VRRVLYPVRQIILNFLKKSLPIRTILLLAFLLVGLLPIVLMSVSAFFQAKSALTTEITHDMQTRANATANEIDRLMFERLQNVASWSRLELMQDARIGDVDKRLSHFLQELKTSYRDVYVNLYVIDLDNKIIASSDAAYIGAAYQWQAEWLKVALPASEITLLKPDANTLAITAEINDSLAERPIGKLVAVLNWQQINHILEDAVSGRGAAVLFDKNAQVIAHTAHWRQDGEGYFLKAQGVSSSYLGLGWRFEIAQHKAEVLAPVRQMTHIFIGLLSASIVLAILIGLPLVKYLTEPLDRLTLFAQHFMRAPTKSLPPLEGPQEVRTMSIAFSKMIADLERSKEALTRAAKLAVAGEMASAMNHEIRTPLGILRSSAQILSREPNLSADSKEICGFMMSETERLNKLVTTLMDAGRMRPPEYAATDISVLIEQAIAMMRMQADKKSINLFYAKPAALIVPCDSEQMTQVLFNLLMNAIYVLPEGGKILVNLIQEAEFAVIEVADNGIGVPEAIQTQIFDPFFTRREGGMGLGLAVVHSIIEAHHGKISVRNGAAGSEYSGAHFRVKLPILGAINP
jgi:signal transduction histidine kinase